MRFLLKATMPTEAGNQLIKSGMLAKKIESILSEQKPEAVYFTAEYGLRTAYLIVHMNDASQIPALAEPWFLAFNAEVEFLPIMSPEDLKKAGPAIESAVKKHA